MNLDLNKLKSRLAKIETNTQEIKIKETNKRDEEIKEIKTDNGIEKKDNNIEKNDNNLEKLYNKRVSINDKVDTIVDNSDLTTQFGDSYDNIYDNIGGDATTAYMERMTTNNTNINYNNTNINNADTNINYNNNPFNNNNNLFDNTPVSSYKLTSSVDLNDYINNMPKLSKFYRYFKYEDDPSIYVVELITGSVIEYREYMNGNDVLVYDDKKLETYRKIKYILEFNYNQYMHIFIINVQLEDGSLATIKLIYKIQTDELTNITNNEDIDPHIIINIIMSGRFKGSQSYFINAKRPIPNKQLLIDNDNNIVRMSLFERDFTHFETVLNYIFNEKYAEINSLDSMQMINNTNIYNTNDIPTIIPAGVHNTNIRNLQANIPAGGNYMPIQKKKYPMFVSIDGVIYVKNNQYNLDELCRDGDVEEVNITGIVQGYNMRKSDFK